MSAPFPTPASALLVDGRPTGPAEVARTRRSWARGLLGRSGVDGVLVLPETASVHTVGMRFTIDVALCTAALEVLAVRTLAPGRVLLPRRGVRTIVEAEAGAFARWGVRPDTRLAVA